MSKIPGPSINSVEVKPANHGKTLLIGIVCVCGADSLIDEASGHSSEHRVEIGAIIPKDTVLRCSCGNVFTLHPQRTHVHVSSGRPGERVAPVPVQENSTIMSVRIEPTEGGRAVLIDVVCACGRNGLMDETSDQSSFKHAMAIWTMRPKNMILACDCGNEFTLLPQDVSAHVFSGRR